jgi:enamine deaminase RidA (YjgF/YER057c/UK114 family)
MPHLRPQLRHQQIENRKNCRRSFRRRPAQRNSGKITHAAKRRFPLTCSLASWPGAEYTRALIARASPEDTGTTEDTMGSNSKSVLNRRAGFLFLVLAAAGLFTVRGAFSQAPAQSSRRAIHLPDANPQLPFSDGILAGNTLYLAGRIGLDKSGKAPAEINDEIKILLDQIKATLEQAGMTMDDLVYVQIACTDLSLFDKFNSIYRAYFTTKDLPAREFIGAAALLRGGHFELQAIAVRH